VIQGKFILQLEKSTPMFFFFTHVLVYIFIFSDENVDLIVDVLFYIMIDNVVYAVCQYNDLEYDNINNMHFMPDCRDIKSSLVPTQFIRRKVSAMKNSQRHGEYYFWKSMIC
jgi:hypothetical protein